jgi:superfamily II DNA or RNA helicase
VLTHYEAMVKWQTLLAQTYFSVIIGDEIHRIKNRQTKRSKVIKTLRAYRKIGLSGTVYDRNPADIHSILQWLAPDFFTSYWRFFNTHVNSELVVVKKEKRDTRGNVIEAAVTVQQVSKQPLKDATNFARTLRPFMIQRKKEDVRSDLPAKIEQYIDLEMGKKQAQLYYTIKDAPDPVVTIGEGVQTSVSIILTRILREIQVTTDPSLLGLTDVPSVKLEWLHEWLADNPQESVIIFTRFRDTALKLHQQLGDQFKLIVGGNRAEITPQDRYIVGTISAMGEGLDVPHIDNAIFIDCEWSSILMQQAIDRIHRINIDNAKNIYYLRCINTADMLLHEALRNKWSTKELTEHYLNGRKVSNSMKLSTVTR